MPLSIVLIALMVVPCLGRGAERFRKLGKASVLDQSQGSGSPRGTSLQGVAFVYNMLGKKDTYILPETLTWQGYCGHSSGMFFRVRFTSDGPIGRNTEDSGGNRLAVNAVRK